MPLGGGARRGGGKALFGLGEERERCQTRADDDAGTHKGGFHQRFVALELKLILNFHWRRFLNMVSK